MLHRKFYKPVSRWLIGFFVGTMVIATTSPWFVRSYVPLLMDSVRETWTLAPGSHYRWRHEGYASTAIGPHGMPGQTEVATPSDPRVKIALWGDSQVEGVCVKDADKLFAQLQREMSEQGREVIVYPFARSGEDLSTWLPQVARVEKALDIDQHIFLVVEQEDYEVSVPTVEVPSDTNVRQGMAAVLPAFVIHAARNVLTQADGHTPRSLRWSVGPVSESKPDATGSGTKTGAESGEATESNEAADSATVTESIDGLNDNLKRLREATDRPILLVHAPRRPEVLGDSVTWKVDRPDHADAFRRQVLAQKMDWLDATDDLVASGMAGRWPHGFHNSVIGAGHLNATGYQVLARTIAKRLAVEGSSVELIAPSN
ncbi:MAG: hypothetical protein AAF989_17145 [Planctomycetota bacterium]